jgi:hypothetical protein
MMQSTCRNHLPRFQGTEADAGPLERSQWTGQRDWTVSA